MPVSVSALSSSDLEGLKYRDAGDISAQIPNLQAVNTAGDGFPIFSLRGVSMSDFSFNQSSPVASYVDEVYKGNPAIQGVQIFDLERIEVLRGPQGTLYGKNSTGGAVNFITKKPSFERSGYVTAGFGDYDRREIQGAFETPIVDDVLAVRLAGTWVEQDGWFENVQPGLKDGNAIDEYGLRFSAVWQATETLEFILRASTGELDAVNYGIQPYNISEAGVGAGLYGLYNELGATDAVDSRREGLDYFEFDSDQDAKRNIDNDAIALTVNWDLNETHTLTSITSWDDGEIFVPEDSDGTANQVVISQLGADAEQFTQDLRITSDSDGALNYIVGFYYAKEEASNQSTLAFWKDLDLNVDGSLDYNDCLDPLYISFGLGPATPAGAATEELLNSFGISMGEFVPAGCQVQNDFDQERTSQAVYADTRYDVTDSLTLRFGLRYTEDDTELQNFSARILGNDDVALLNTIPGDPVNPYATSVDDEINDDQWTWKVGVDYTTLAGNLLYANASHGYRNGGFNAQAFFDPSELTSVNPETLDAFEVGFKSEWLDGSLQLNGAAFFYTYEDQQFLDIDPNTAAQKLVNIDESEILGLELEMVARPIDSVLVRAGLGLLDTEVKKGTLNGVNLKGNELIMAPELNFNAAIDWDVWSGSPGTAVVRFDTSYVDDHYFEIFNVDRMQEEGYWVHNARLQFDSSDDAWSVSVWAKNLADEEYRTSAIDLQGFGYDYSHIGAPRTYGLEATYRF